LYAMIKHGGLVIPSSMEKDLNILYHACKCDMSSLDVINRELEVKNFSVALPTKREDIAVPPALRIGRLFLKWDSYRAPCIEIVVEDVDIMVEFVNLLLTKNNWDELKEIGFPPSLGVPMTETSMECPSESTFVRIGGLYLLGNVTLSTRSRPMNKPIVPDLIFEFSTLDDLMDAINTKAGESIIEVDYWSKQTRKSGCTTDEMYEILGKWVNKRLMQMLSDVAIDLGEEVFRVQGDDTTFSESDTVSATKRLFEEAKSALKTYTKSAAAMTEERIQEKLTSQLEKWGVSENHLQKVREATKVAADAAVASLQGVTSLKEDNMQLWDLSAKQIEWLKKGYKAAADAAVSQFLENDAKNDNDKEEIFFPPW